MGVVVGVGVGMGMSGIVMVMSDAAADATVVGEIVGLITMVVVL